MALNRSKILREAERFTQQGRIEQAIARFEALIQDNPRDVSTVNKVGDLYARIGRIPEAVQQFMMTAEFYATDGFLLKAIAIYKKVTKLAPDNLDAFLKLGELYDQQGLPIEAKTQYLSIAEKLKKKGDFERAREVYERILKIDSGDVRARIQMADLQMRQGKTREALENFSLIGEDLKSKGKSEEYEKILERALQADPAHGVVARSLARLYLEKGEAPRAVSLARKVADARPQDEDAVVLLAETYLNSNSAAEAEQIIRAAPDSLVGSSPDLQAILCRAQLAGEQVDAAERTLETAVALLTGQDRGGEAIPLLQEFLRARPAHPGVLRHLYGIHRDRGELSSASGIAVQLAETLKGAGSGGEAIPVLEEIQGLDPGNAEVRSALESLQKSAPAEATAQPPSAGKAAEPPPAPAAAPETPAPEPDGDGIEVDLSMGAEDPVPAAPPSPPAPPAAAGAVPSPAAEPESTPESGPEPARKAGPEAEIAGEDFEGYYAEAGNNLMGAQAAGDDEVEDQDFIQEHLTEAEVFMKYRLIEKAVERINEVLKRYPRNLAANERLQMMYLEEGDRDNLVPQALRVSELLEAQNESERAVDAVVAALRVVPDHPSLRNRLKDLGIDNPEEFLEEEGSPPTVAEAVGPRTPDAGDPKRPGTDLEIELDLDEPDIPAAGSSEAAPPEAAPSVPAVEEEPDEPERPLQERLREIDFFMEQELWDEARGLLEVMRIREGDHPQVEARWKELQQRQAAAKIDREENSDIALEIDRALGGTPAPPVPKPGKPKAGKSRRKTAGGSRKTPAPDPGRQDFFDLGSELQRELELDEDGAEEEEILKGIDVSKEGHSVDELFQAFRKGVEEQVDKGDYETHYQLGIAYKEMGLLDEAIGEFQYAAKEPKLFLDCCSILGLCFREKGMVPLAIGWYQKALKTPGFAEEDYLGVRYDLAQILMENGKKQEAMDLLMTVYGVNSNYRDVSNLVQRLQKDLKK